MIEKLKINGDSPELNTILEPYNRDITDDKIYKNLPEEGPFNIIKRDKDYLKILENKLKLANEKYAALVEEENQLILKENYENYNIDIEIIKHQIQEKLEEIQILIMKIDIVKNSSDNKVTNLKLNN